MAKTFNLDAGNNTLDGTYEYDPVHKHFNIAYTSLPVFGTSNSEPSINIVVKKVGDWGVFQLLSDGQYHPFNYTESDLIKDYILQKHLHNGVINYSDD